MNALMSIKKHLGGHWHHHVAAVGLAIAALALTAGATAELRLHGGFRRGPMAPQVRYTGSVPPPSSASLAGYLTRIHNQGTSNSCVGQGLSTLVEIVTQERNHHITTTTTRGKNGKPGTHWVTTHKTVPSHGKYRFSAGFIYDQANGGVDQGTTFQAAFGILTGQGDARLKQFPHDGPDWWVQPSAAVRALARPYRFHSWASIATSDRTTMEHELSQGRPFVIAFPVHDTIYYHFNTNTPIAYDTGSFHFWHVMTAIGYDQTGLRMLNSWGTSWGQNGRATLTWSFIANSGGAVAIADP